MTQLQAEIELRDHKDSTRKVSPLTQATDATLVDTTPMSIDEVVAAIAKIITKNKVQQSNCINLMLLASFSLHFQL